MNAVAKIDQVPAAQPESATLLAVISRAASDPNTDVDKFERLMAMHNAIEAKRAESAFYADLADMQDELPAIGERGNAAGRYTYALWEDINTAIKPVMKRFGFALSFRTDFADGIAVTGVLTHKGGHKIETTIKLPADPSGNKNAVQAVASSVSYGKRYTAGALLNLTSHGEDDDAYATGKVQEFDQAWLDKIADMSDKISRDAVKSEMLAHWGAPQKVPKNLMSAYNRRIEELRKESSK